MNKESTRLGPRGLINRTEYVRLLQQSLNDLGFEELAKQLEVASVRTHIPLLSLLVLMLRFLNHVRTSMSLGGADAACHDLQVPGACSGW